MQIAGGLILVGSISVTCGEFQKVSYTSEQSEESSGNMDKALIGLVAGWSLLILPELTHSKPDDNQDEGVS
jgi:hypothetical protein